MTLVIGISGKKQSGKSSLAEFIKAWYFCQRHDYVLAFQQKADGEIVFFSDPKKSDTQPGGGLSCNSLIKIYSFAGPLKQKVAIDILGLSEEQCNGTNKQKDSLTDYVWDSFPLEIRERYSTAYEEYVRDQDTSEMHEFKVPRSGYMTAREILQVTGTDIFRNMFNPQVWVNATLRSIKRDAIPIALIPDVRFESELDAIIAHDGYLIRLDRQVGHDDHPSETALDGYDFEALGDRCLYIENNDLTIEKKNDLVCPFLERIFQIYTQMA